MLTPVQKLDGLYFKRDDLYRPFGAKTMKWFANSGLPKEGTLFWIVGAEPKGG